MKILRAFSAGLVALSLASAVAVPAQEDALELTLQDALGMAMEQNFDIKIQRLTLQGSEFGLKGAYGAYDPEVTVDWSSRKDLQPTSSSLQVGFGSQEAYLNRNEGFTVGLNQYTPWGQGFSLTWQNSLSRSNSTFSNYNPSYSSSLQLGTSIPLLRGSGYKIGHRTVLQAKYDFQAAGERFASSLRDTLASVESSYWDLAYAIHDLRVKEKSLELARKFQEETRLKIEVGVLAPIEQVAADASVAEREQDIITGRALVGDLEDILRLSMGYTKDSPEWGRPILPLDTPSEDASVDYEESGLIEKAFRKRPELRELRANLEKNKLDTHWARRELLPKLDLVASMTYNGIAGDGLVSLGDYQTGPWIYQDQAYGDAWSMVRDRDFRSWYVALQFSYPIGNRSGRATYRSYRLAQNSTEISIRRTEQIVANEVRSSLRNLEASVKRIAAAKLNVRLQREKLEAEEKKFQNGLSTSFQVLSYQNDLARAETTLLSAWLDFVKASAGLDQAVGVYLEARDIRLQDPGADAQETS